MTQPVQWRLKRVKAAGRLYQALVNELSEFERCGVHIPLLKDITAAQKVLSDLLKDTL